MISKQLLGFFGLLPIQLNAHLARYLGPYYILTSIAICELSSQVFNRTLSQNILLFWTFEL